MLPSSDQKLRLRPLIVTAVCFALTIAAGHAQLPGGPVPPQIAQGRAEGLTPEIEGLLKRMLAAYKKLDAYSDGGRLTMIQEMGRVRQATKMPSATDLQRPNRIQVLAGIQTISCDGEQLQIVLDRLRQYRQQKAPEAIGMGHIRMGAPGAALDQGYPEILEFLLGQSVYARWVSQIDSIRKRPEPVTIAGRECPAIIYQTVNKAYITLYLDPESSLLLRADIDNTEAQRTSGTSDTATLPTLNVVLQFDPIKVGSDVSDSDGRFALRDATAEGMRLVQRFESQAPGDPTNLGGAAAPPSTPPQHPLVGKPAPEIAGAPAEKKPTLYFLWSPRGDAGSLASVQMVQRLADKYNKPGADPSLSVLGISARSDITGLAKDILEAKKAKFRNIVDTDSSLAGAFSVSGLPSFAIVGPDGVVRDVIHGAPAQIEKELAEKLEALLAVP